MNLKKKLKTFYDGCKMYGVHNLAWQDELVSKRNPFVVRLEKYTSPETGVLAVGCGAGRFLDHITPMSKLCVGVDIGSTTIGTAHQYRHDPRTMFVVADAENLPFADEAFEFIYSHQAVEHFVNPYVALDEMVRCLKKGGPLYLDIPKPEINLEIGEDKKTWAAADSDKDAVSRLDNEEFSRWVKGKDLVSEVLVLKRDLIIAELRRVK